MSSYIKAETGYVCSSDCDYFGCKGHVLVVKHHSTCDLDEVFVDGESRLLCDPNMLMALLAALDGAK